MAKDFDDQRTAAITGLGVVSPAGSDVATFWNAMLEGRSVARRIDELSAATLPVDFGCAVTDFDPARRMSEKAARRMDRFAQFAVVAALDAVDDADLVDVDLDRAAVVVGNGGGGARTSFEQYRRFFEDGPEWVNPLSVPMAMSNAAAALIGVELGWHGPNFTVSTACASGGHAIGEGLRMIRDGSADVVLAGGTEAGMTRSSVNAFCKVQALSSRMDEPHRASRPFDRDRDGFVMGEGAAFLCLERVDQARARKADIHALVAGYGRNCDAYHLVMPPADGRIAARCMELALADASLGPSDVAHVHAHGTSTPRNDLAEARAIATVFGSTAPPVTSSKGVLGHLVSGAGAVGALASCLAAREGAAPPTANHETTDPAISIDVVAGKPRPIDRRAVVCNSFGFGGHNASLVITPS